MDVLATLRGAPMFAGLASYDLAALAALAADETFEPGTSLFEEGQTATNLYLLVEGKVALEKALVVGRRGEVRRVTVEVVGPSEVFGWSALVEPRRLTASAVCVTQSRVLAFPSAGVEGVLRERPTSGYEIMRRLAGIASLRLRDTTARLSYLLSTASHDIKAPLVAVGSYVQAMLSGYAGPLNDKQRETLVSCRDRLAEAQELISNYLELSRLEAGQANDQMVPCSLTAIVERALSVIQPAARDKGVALVADLPGDLPATRGLPLRLQQVIVNVLSNAVKFTPSGGQVKVSLNVNQQKLRLEVVDTGVGISSDDLPRIFDDFYSGGVAETGSAGLGLAVAKRIIAAHGGRIWAESPTGGSAGPGAGSRFVVTLPLQETDASTTQAGG